MNVSSVKALCMVTSATLSAGLAFVLWNFFQNEAQKQPSFDEQHALRVLQEEPEAVAEIKTGVDYQGEVKPSWILLDWTGAPEPEPVVEVAKEPEEAKPKYVPVKELVAITFIRFDTDDEAGSRAYVRYIGGGITEKEGTLKVGDTLPRPHQTVTVDAIFPHGIEFGFGDSDREAELLEEVPVTDGDLIHVAGADGALVPRRRALVQQGQVQIFRPAETTLIAPDRYRLGEEDMKYLNDNYTDVLTRDVGTKTHYDSNGKRAGIELTRVRKGSIAARHGAQEGDIIKSINGQPVNSTQEAINFAKNNKDRYSTWEIVVENLGRERTITYESPSN